ncbi:MAG: TonB-dependent receptor [Flavobacteriaceae bacterium]|nr:TonB-dependent receptor [Flavobacteriaceae bacterium]
MLRFFFIVNAFLIFNSGYSQIVIKGRIIDQNTRNPLKGVLVFLDGLSDSARSNSNGDFEIGNAEPGFHTIYTLFDGFKSSSSPEQLFTFDKSPFVEIEMESLASEIGEVRILKSSLQTREAESPVSSQKLSIREIERNPGGNRDISKIIQSLPGVVCIPGFRNDVVIRGGAPSENKFYLDGIEIPIINHFQTQGSTGGPVGMLNVNFIKEVNFYTGAFPINFANGLSSVLDFRQIDGNSKKSKFRFSLGSSDLGFTADGPLGKKVSYIFSARQSYLQGLFSVLGLPFLPNFIDYQAKVKWKLNEKDDITFLMIGAVDFFKLNLGVNDKITDSVKLKTNKFILGYLPVYRQWNYTVGSVYTHYGIQSKTQLFASRNMLSNTFYKYRNNDESLEGNRIFSYSSTEEENRFRVENFRTKGSWKLLIGGGLEFVQYWVDNNAKVLVPGAPGSPGSSKDIVFKSNLELFKYSAFFRGYRSLMGNGTFNISTRLDASNYNQNNSNPLNQPTISVGVSLPTPVKGIFVNGSLGQFFQLPSYTILGYRKGPSDFLPPDPVWVPGNLENKDRVKYIRNRTLALGLQSNQIKDTRITLEGFYKQYANYPFALRDSICLGNLGTDFAVLGNEPVASVSDGKAYGIEFLVQRRSRSGLYGIVAYTLSWSEFNDKNGKSVQSAWDSRHTLSLVGGLKMKRNWEMGAKYRIASGRPYTPDDLQRSLVQSNWDIRGTALPNYSLLNTQRLQTFTQLDIRIDKVWYFKSSSLNLYLDIQNALNSVYSGPQTLIAAQDGAGKLITDFSAAIPSYKSEFLPNNSGFLQPSIGVIWDF